MAPLNDWPWRHWARTQPQATALMLGEQPLSWLALQSRWMSWRRISSIRALNRAAAWRCAVKQLSTAAGLSGAVAVRRTPVAAQSRLADAAAGAAVAGIGYDLCLRPGLVAGAAGRRDSIDPPSTEPRWPDLPTWDAQRLATLTLTSGSSGMPKAAAHSYANHLASAAGVLELMAFQREDCWLLSLPLFHVSGQGIVWRWLAAGARLAVREMHPLNEALAGCTHASLVPTQLWRLLAQPLAGMTLKAVLLGGAMIPVELTERAEEAGIRCWCGYGLTELASTVCAKRADARPGVGLPLGGREIKLVDEEVWIRAESGARLLASWASAAAGR